MAPRAASKSDHRPHSNLDYCIYKLSAIGFETIVFELSPSMFGMPVSRPRLWLLAIRKTLLA
eukprot:3086864-Alexandrium_andersonii.AAC.1